MKVLFSFDYKGGMAYLDMRKQPVMMDTLVVDINGLINFLELRLGLSGVGKSQNERLVAYHKCVRDYMKSHNDANNQLYASYLISPLATSKEMLRWRDALSIAGWTKETPAPSRRLKVLQGVESAFDSEAFRDMSTRIRNVRDKLKEKKGVMNDVVFAMPYDVNWLDPALKEIFSLSAENGAKIEKLETPQIEGESNLSKLKRILISGDSQTITFDAGDDSVRIWKFKDGMRKEEYISMLQDDEFDVTIQKDTKLTDNFLRMMGKPVTGSSVANSAPQIIQLFFTGLALMDRPLNINVLMQWLYAPTSPLPVAFRRRLAIQLANNGGWRSKDTEERSPSCRQMVSEWINGTEEEPVEKKEQNKRRHLAEVFLPDFDAYTEDRLTAGKLHTFLRELSLWGKQHTAMLAGKDANGILNSQLERLSELCSTLMSLTDDYQPDDLIAYTEIEKHMTCLYEPSEFVQYQAQASSRLTLQEPGQVAASADKVLWAGLNNYEPLRPATDFLTPSEVEVLKGHLTLWDPGDARKIQQTSLLLPIMFCKKQLTLVSLDTSGDKEVDKHPLMVRIEQQVKNHTALTSEPSIPEGEYKSVEPLTDNSACGSDGLYAEVSRTDLINWRENESPTSLEELIQNPVDYALENIAFIRDNGESAMRNLATTKGNVAHAVIQNLFLTKEEGSGYPRAIRERMQARYREEFDDVVETKGAILLLQENAIERRQLYERLQECIENLIDIIEKDDLHVVACEMPLHGNTLGESDAETPQIHGYADMVLAREDGQRIIFDFKWTSSKSYYQGLLQKNSSTQLAIYANLLEEQTMCKAIPTAYFLMPIGKLYSSMEFSSSHANKVEVKEDVEGEIISKIKASYHYRRDEIMSGKIEIGELHPLDSIDYAKDTAEKGLLPLKPQYKQEDLKANNDFSNYKILKK